MLQPLPIDSLLPRLLESLRTSPNAVITAEPGAGKSTRVPPAVAGEIKGKVLLLQPRRVAARAVSARIAAERNWTLGKEIGYQIRFENRTSAQSRIIVMTEGILARRIQSDPFLEGVGCVILDEFHERSLHTDTAIALLREIQTSVRPDLQIIVMSATLDAAAVAGFLETEAVFSSPGRTFPLEIIHSSRNDQRPMEQRLAEAIDKDAASAAMKAAPHILIFLPGMAEIRRTANALADLGRKDVHVLHSSVSACEQEAALRPGGQQKIILATNIAETSLTIDGVGLVFDSGLARVPVHDTRLGFDRLEVRRISKASATQRAGRAGRSGPGKCIRMYSAEEFAAMEDYESPEIQRLDLASLLLTLKSYGVTKISDFQWFEAPPTASLQRAVHLLRMLEALTPDDALTAWGKALSDLPLHPRLGSVFLHGVSGGAPVETAWLCALLEAGDVTPTAGAAGRNESDPLDRLEEVLKVKGAAPWAVKTAAEQLQRLADKAGRAAQSAAVIEKRDKNAILRQALLRGFPDRVVLRRTTGDVRGLMVGRRGIRLAGQSRVVGAQLFVAVDVRDNERTPAESTVYSASSVELPWLEKLFPHLYRTEDGVRMSGVQLAGVRRQMFADLVLSEKDLGGLPEGFDPAEALRLQLLQQHGSAQGCFLSVENVEPWLRRYLFLYQAGAAGELPLPDYGAALEMACQGARSRRDFEKNALHCLHASLPQQAVRGVAELAPEYLELPSGNRSRIEYPEIETGSGLPDPDAIPKVSARVQELFGLAETPRVAGGRVPILVQLLSPAMRPVQVTRDLKSFWNTTYQEVRKELRARYPKHPWPEDPWTAPAVSIGRRRR